MRWLRERLVGVGGDGKARHDQSRLDRSGIGDDEVDDRGDNEVEKKDRNLSKSKETESGFFTSGARMAFTKLR